jgi:HK97 family phage portal protein
VSGLLTLLSDGLSGRIDDRRRQAREVRSADSLAELLLTLRGGPTYSGVPVDDEQAMRLGAVWSCVDLLSELVSTLPVDEYRRVEGGPPVVLPPSTLLTDPSGDGSGFEVWCRQVMTSLLLRGNAFGLVSELGEGMWPDHVAVLHPDRVSLRRELNFGPVEWLLDNKPIEKWPAGPLWHLQAYSMPGSPVGLSPIRYAAETIGLGLATRKFGAQWFGDGAHPTAVLESEYPIDEDQAKVLKQRVYDALHGGRGALIMGAGATLKPMQVSPNESQFLETIKANADDVARFFFRRPPGEGGQVTYANVEARSLDLLTYTVGPWLVRLERSLSRLRARPRFVKFNADALLRVDLLSRYKAHDIAIRGGFASPDERRRLEDLPPVPGGAGQQFLWPPGGAAPKTPSSSPVGGSNAQ